jgi:hypothetical protein
MLLICSWFHQGEMLYVNVLWSFPDNTSYTSWMSLQALPPGSTLFREWMARYSVPPPPRLFASCVCLFLIDQPSNVDAGKALQRFLGPPQREPLAHDNDNNNNSDASEFYHEDEVEGVSKALSFSAKVMIVVTCCVLLVAAV